MSMNISVDDILDEIKQSKNQNSAKPLASMDHVDELIKEILEKRQSDELKRQGRTVSLKEKMELEEEIKEKTKTLTVEFEKMRQNHDKRLEEVIHEKPEQRATPAAVNSSVLEQEYAKSHAMPSVHMTPTQELNILRVQKNQQVKFRNTAEIEISQEIKAHREQKYDKLKKAANSEHILSEMKNITDHFGNFKMEDKSVEDGYQRLAINPASYKELKSNRSRVVDAFVLEPKKPPQKDLNDKASLQNQIADEVLSSTASTEVENEFSISEEVMNSVKEKRETARENPTFSQENEYEPSIGDDIEYDYNHRSQKQEILESLNKTLSKTNTSMVVLAVLSVLSLGLIFSRPSDENILMAASIPVSPMIYAFVMLGLLLASIIASFSIFSNAFHSIAEKKPDKDILYSIGLIVSFLSTSFLSINPQKLLTVGVCYYLPVMIILLFVNFFSKRITVKEMIASFEKISGEEELYAVTPVADVKAVEGMMSGITMGASMLLRNVRTGFVRRFLAHACVPDKSDYLSGKLAMASIPVTILLFAIAYFLSHDFYLATSIAGAVPLCFIGILLSLLVSMPLKDASGVARHFAGAMPDYDAIDTYNETDGVMLEATDLFPENSVLLHGIKTFKGKRIDNAILDAASVICAAKSVLEPVFLSIIASQTKLLKPVDSIVYEDAMGISAWVNEKRVLIGNRELMINHSIAVPKEEYENKYKEQNHELVYLSCEGELSAAFVIEFTASSKAVDMVDLLQKNEVAMLIRSVDSSITQELIERVFDIAPDTFKILPSHMHRVFAEQHEPLKNTDGAMPNNGGAFSMVVLIAVCKRMTSCIKLGFVMQIVATVGALLLLTASLILKLPSIAGPLQLMLFMLFFFVVYWIYEKNVKL